MILYPAVPGDQTCTEREPKVVFVRVEQFITKRPNIIATWCYRYGCDHFRPFNISRHPYANTLLIHREGLDGISYSSLVVAAVAEAAAAVVAVVEILSCSYRHFTIGGRILVHSVILSCRSISAGSLTSRGGVGNNPPHL